jgi:hypothetical protein
LVLSTALLWGSTEQAEPFAKPAVIQFGASAAELEHAFEGLCKTLTTRPVEPPFLPEVKRQTQIDCDGFEFAGKPRWAEFVIGDDSLEMVWIMTEADEHERILAAMTAVYGAPTHRNNLYDAFAGHRAALRSTPHEVLFYSERLAPAMIPDFAPTP